MTSEEKLVHGLKLVIQYRIWIEAKRGNLEHLKVGNRFLFRRSALDKWARQQEENSVKKEDINSQYGKLRKQSER